MTSIPRQISFKIFLDIYFFILAKISTLNKNLGQNLRILAPRSQIAKNRLKISSDFMIDCMYFVIKTQFSVNRSVPKTVLLTAKGLHNTIWINLMNCKYGHEYGSRSFNYLT